VLVLLFSLVACSAENTGNKVVELSFKNGRVSASFSDAPIQEVAALIAENTHVVIKVFDGVDETVNGQFDQLPLNQFLKKVFKPYNTSFVYTGKAKENIKGVFLLNEGESAAKAKVFIPEQGASMLSKFAQHQRSSVSDAKVSSPVNNVEMQRKNKKRSLVLYLDNLKQQMVVAKQEKKDFSGLQQKIKSLEMKLARLEKIPALPGYPTVNRPKGLQKYSGF